MTVQFELPNNIENALRGQSTDLNQLAKESVLVELFRQDKISRYELSQALSLGRMETDELLNKHHVTEDLGTVEDYNAALAGLREKWRVIVVSDTSPLNYLILIDAIDVLQKLFPEVFTTNLVLQELSHPKAPEPVRRWAQAPPQWLNVVDPVSLLPSTTKLDPGEASAISLAKERSIVNIMIDELKGTKIAAQEHLFPIPTLAIVEIAIEKKLLTAESIERLRATNIRCPKKLFDIALDRAKSRNPH